MGTSAFDKVLPPTPPSTTPTAPATAALDAVLGEAAQEEAFQRGQLTVATERARHANVGAMSEAFGLAKRTGLPVATVARNLEQVRAQAGDQHFDPVAFQAEHPATARWLSTETNAAVSKDDWTNLGAIERLIGRWGRAPRVPFAQRTSDPFTTVQPVLQQSQRGLLQAEYQRESVVLELGRIGLLPPAEREAMRALQAELEARRAEVLPDPANVVERFTMASAKILPSMVESVTAGGVGAAVGGGVGFVAGGPAGAALGAKVGGSLNAFLAAATMEGGNAALEFEKLKDDQGQAIDPGAAYGYGMAYGVASGAVELVGLRFIAEPFANAGRALFRGAVSNALTRPTTRAALMGGAKAWATAVGGETATEVIQTGLQLTQEAELRAVSNWLHDTDFSAIPLERVGRELAETAIETAIGMTLLGIPGGSVSMVEGMARVTEAEAAQDQLTALGEGATASALRERAPEAFRELIHADIETYGPVRSVFISTERLLTVLEQENITPEAFAARVGLTPDALEQSAVLTGADLAIPLADYTAAVAGTPLHETLLPDLKLRVGALSAREAQAMQATLEQDAAAVRDEMEAVAETTPEEASAQAVVADLTAKLEATGVYTPEQVAVMARAASAPYLVLAKRIGQDPLALYQSRRLSIFGPERAGPLYDVTRAVQAAEARGASPDELVVLRQRLNALSNDRVSVRAALEIADQTEDVRDAAGRLKRSLRQVSTDALVLEYLTLRDQVNEAAGQLSAFESDPQMAAAQTLAEEGAAEDAQGAYEDANGSGAVWSFVEMQALLRESRTVVRRYERTVPRLEAELRERGVTDPDAYAETHELRGDASFDVEAMGQAFEQGRSLALATRPEAMPEMAPQSDEEARLFAEAGVGETLSDPEFQDHMRRLWDSDAAFAFARPDGGEYLEMLTRSDLRNARGIEQNRPRESWREDLAISLVSLHAHRLMLAEWNRVNSQRLLAQSPTPPSQAETDVRAMLARQATALQRATAFLKKRGALSEAELAEVARVIGQPVEIFEQAASGRNQLPSGDLLATRDVPATPNERLSDAERTDAESLAEALVANPALVESAGGVDVVARGDVLAMVRGLLQNPQVLQAVVRLVPVEVVNVLAGQELSPQLLLDNPAVLVDLLAVDTDDAVAGRVQAVAVLAHAVAGGATEVLSGTTDGSVTTSALLAAYDTGDFSHLASKVTNNLAVIKNGEPVTPAERTEFLAQSGRSRPNAFILPGKAEQVIGLMETANLSSFLHEMGHEYLNLLAFVAQQPDAPQSVKDDLATFLKEVGKDSFDQVGVKEQEHFARAFESYLMSGQAPSVPLLRAFTRFRIWLTRIYARAKAALVPVSPELRGVFDRLMATDEEIAATTAENAGAQFFETAAEAEMTDAEFAAYQAHYDLRDATAAAHLAKRLLAERNQERTAAWQEREAEVREVVAASVDAEPVEQAVRYFRTGTQPDGAVDPSPVKLAKTALVPLYGDGITKTLPRGTFSVEGGIDPDAAAGMFGFPTGDALVDALQSYEPRAKRIERLVNQQMRREFPDLLGDSPALAEAAQQAAHLADTDNALLADLKALGRSSGQRPPNVAAFKQVARDIIGQTVGRDLRPSRFLNAEATAGRKAYEAMRKGDRVQAAFHKRQQLMNHILYREAKAAEAAADKTLAFFSRMQRAPAQARLGTAGTQYLDAMNALLDAYEFRRVSLRALDKRAALLAWAEDQRRQGIDPAVPASVIMAAERVNYRLLTVDELQGVRDTGEQVWHTATMKDKLLSLAERREFAETRDAILSSIEAHRDLVPRLYQPDKSIMDKAKGALDNLHGISVPPEMLFRILDGDVSDGPVQRALFHPIAAAQHAQTAMLKESSAALAAIFDTIPAERRKGYLERRLVVPGVNRRMTGMTAYVMALNWGNEGNRTALLNSQVDGQMVWTAAQVDAVLSTLTAAEWRAVQATWDYLNTFWPAIAELQRTMTGVIPEKVEALPFTVKAADGEVVAMQGGYYPIKHDTDYSWAAWAADQISLQRAAEGQTVTSYTRAATKHGHTEERVGSGGRPVLLNISVLPNHVLNVIHDLTHRAAVYDVQKLLKDEQVRAAIEQTAGPAVYRNLDPWLRRVAGEQSLPTNIVESILTHARTGTTVVNLGLKVTTALLQPIGITMSADLIGWTWATRGLTEFLRNPVTLTRTVQALSGEMQARRTNFDRDVRDSAMRKGKLSQKESAWFYFTAMADQFVSVSTWWGAYLKSMEVEAPGDQAAAVRAADSAVRLSQGAGAAKDLSVAQSGTPLWRLFNLFYSYGKALYGMFYRAHRNLSEGRWGVGRFVGSIFAIWVLPAVLEPFVTGRGPDEDDEDIAQWWAWRIALYPFQAVVGVRDLARSLGPEGFDYKLSPVEAAFTTATKALGALGAQAVDAVTGDDDEMTRAEFKAFVEAAGYWGHLPVRQMWITGEYLYHWMMGYESPATPGEAVRNLALPRPY